MNVAVLVALLGAGVPAVGAPQSPARSVQPAQPSPDKIGEAYAQFMLGRRLETEDDIDGAIAAFKRAMQLDPTAADVQAELAGLYMRQSRLDEALAAGEQALKLAPANREAHRVLGIVYATLAEGSRRPGSRQPSGAQAETLNKAIEHLEQAVDRPNGETDPNVRATLSRLYIAAGWFDKAIQLLKDLVSQEPGWSDGPGLLAQAFAGAGRNDEAIEWLERETENDPDLFATLGNFYERERRWKEAAAAYGKAVQQAPRNADLKSRYVTALMNAGSREALTRARDVLKELVSARPSDTSSLFQLSQVQRRLGDLAGAESTARQIIAQNGRGPTGYYALAGVLEERRQYQSVVDLLAPVVEDIRSRGANASSEVAVLLPHLGFAYQELGEHEKAISAFEETHRLSPNDASIAAYLVQAQVSAKKYSAAIDLARKMRAEHPDDLRFARLEAQALRQSGKSDEAVSVLQEVVKLQSDKPAAYVALAQIYTDTNRGSEAVKVLQEAQTKFPTDTSISFELGAAFDKQKRFSDAESAFRDVIAREPDHAAALNYLGYMLAERGERLDESVDYVKRALAIDPENGSFLDSLGWAYYKADKLDFALDYLHRAADQLKNNSVVQDHYGDVLFKLGRYDDAIAAWTKSLAGDGDSIERGSIEKKIRAARQKLGKK
jgi:tetratricopeptide (TPR) repeat protein